MCARSSEVLFVCLFILLLIKSSQSSDISYSNYMENMSNDWSPETGFRAKRLHKNGFPKPGIGSGSRLGLSLILNAALDEYYCSSQNGHGFKVLLHAPHELAMIDEFGIGISNGFESRIVAKPMITGASKAIRRIPMHVRQCVYQSENFLDFYRVYSRENCKIECFTKICLANCDCVLYYMLRPHQNISICGQRNAKCLDNVERELLLRRNDSFKCECFHGCDSIKFDMSSSATPIFQNAPILKKRNLTALNIAILHVFFQNGYYSSQNKEELIGFTEFLSNIGGLLGLFMGFSVFSIIEVLYFLSIRPYCNYVKAAQKRRQERQRGFSRFNHVKLKGVINRKSNNIKSIHGNSALSDVNFPHIY